MNASITSTDQIVEIDAVGGSGRTMARVWEGVTERGVQFVAYIPLVQVRRTADNAQFEAELSEHKRPDTDTVRAIAARFIL